MKIIVTGLLLIGSISSFATNVDLRSYNLGKIAALEEQKILLAAEDRSLEDKQAVIQAQIDGLKSSIEQRERDIKERQKKLDAFFESK